MSGRQDNHPTPASLLTGLPPLDRRASTPLYSQLAAIIEDEIVAGRWGVGTQLPAEPALGAHFELSRPTVRQALAALEQAGLLERRHGHGTFVAHAEPRSWLVHSPDGFFGDESGREKRTVTSQLLSAQRGPLPRWATDRLRLPPGSDGVTLERVRSVDGLVALYVVNHLPDWLTDTALALSDPDASLYEHLKEKEQVVVAGGDRILEAVPAPEHIAKLLDCSSGSPVVLVESTSWDRDLRPFDCYRAWVRSDRMKIKLEVFASRIPADGGSGGQSLVDGSARTNHR